jgi:hypothetical protein
LVEKKTQKVGLGVGGTFGTYGEKINAHTVLIAKPEEKSPI